MEFEIFKNDSDYFGIILQVEKHVVDQVEQKYLHICILVVEVVMNVNLHLFKVAAAFSIFVFYD